MAGNRRFGVAATIALLGATCAGLGPLASSASATTFNVTNTNDAGAGSLRQALLDAAAASGPDTVDVQNGLGTITLDSEILWTASGTGDQSVTVLGNGIIVDINGNSRGLVDNGGRGITIDGVSLTGAGGTTADNAAPLVSEGGPIVATKCTISG